MPFVKRGKYYYSPSGRRWTKKQVALYHATHGFKDKPKKQKSTLKFGIWK